jgi:hypothetical protein
MATTWITLAKIAGPLVGEVERLFRRWAEYDAGAPSVARKLRVPADGNPGVADPAIVAEMVALIEDLERHAEAPPVVYFARYVDPWTTAASLSFTSAGGPLAGVRPVLSADVDLAFFRPSRRRKLKGSIEADLRAGDRSNRFPNFEAYQFANQLYNCLIAWEDVLEARGAKTGVVLAFQSVGGLWLDEEVEASARTLPSWFGDGSLYRGGAGR